jgi:hypothetical protein
MSNSVQIDGWDNALCQAFAILLGRPVEEFPDATYAAYSDIGPDLSSLFFEADFDVGPLARGEIVQPPFHTIPQLRELLDPIVEH